LIPASIGTDADVFTAEIIRNGLTNAAVEMSKTLARTARSTLLYDVQDFGVGIVDRDGAVWGEAPGITIFTGCLGETIRGGVAKLGHDGFADGDVLIVNDPYLTGTHLSDVSVYVPILVAQELVGFAIATAHWADVGAKAPGGWCPDSTDVYQEGVCFGHQRLVAGGVESQALRDLILENVRLPETVWGDLQAQIASCRLGAERVKHLCERYAVGGVRSAMSDVIERTRTAMRRRIADLPDGTYTAQITMDWDGVSDDRPTVAVEISIDGEEVTASLARSSPATRGPINLPAVGTRGAVRIALKAMLMPFDRTNEGHFSDVGFEFARGSIVSPERPAPCDSYGYVNGAVGELVFQALAPIVPERAIAGGLQLLAVFLSRVDPRDGDPFMFIEPVHGGSGAGASDDGHTLTRFADGDASNTSTEVIELRYPLRCERHELRPEVSGVGAFRGGAGIRRDYRALEDGIYLQTANENTLDVLCRGLDGGRDGGANEVVIDPGTAQARKLERRVSQFGPLAIGTVVSLRTSGGGGWGQAHDRDPEMVLADVRGERLTADDARIVYGVAIEAHRERGWTLDELRTTELRGPGHGSD
jgi:N-methylhydantoinase B